MITIKTLTSKSDIDKACALLHEVYIEELKWNFESDNPSHIRIEVKNNKKVLVDRFTNQAIWFGAFLDKNLVGCARLCARDKNGKFEVEAYPTSIIISKYLNESNCLEVSKFAVKNSYQQKLFLTKYIFFNIFKYCQKNNYSLIALTHNRYLKFFFEQINFPLKIAEAFKYEVSDPSSVNFYYASVNNGEISNMIKNLDYLENHLNAYSKSNIIRALELVAPILPALIYWHDVNGVVLGANGICLKSMGATKEQVIGKTPFDFYPKDVAEHILIHNEKVIKTGQVMPQEETINNITTGELKVFMSIKAPLYDENGKVIGIVGTSVDITSEKLAAKLQLENQAYQAEIRSQEKFRKFIDKILHTIQSYKIDYLNEQLGIQNKNVEENSKISLTKREKEILYFLSMRKSPKEIASILSKLENKKIASSTINAIINKRLYIKFEVFNISQLLDKANLLNLIPFLPEWLSKNNIEK